MRHPLVWFVQLWRRLVSPLYGDVCKYHPSCSAYALESLQVHGAVKGSALTAWRLLRCNPFSPGGYDPVPGTAAAQAWAREQRSSQREAPDSPALQPAGTTHNPRGDI